MNNSKNFFIETWTIIIKAHYFTCMTQSTCIIKQGAIIYDY